MKQEHPWRLGDKDGAKLLLEITATRDRDTSESPAALPLSLSFLPPWPRTSDQLHSSPFGNRNFLLCLGGHRVQLPSKEGAHFFCHWHVLRLKLLDVLDQLQDAGRLRGPQGSHKGVTEDWP